MFDEAKRGTKDGPEKWVLDPGATTGHTIRAADHEILVGASMTPGVWPNDQCLTLEEKVINRPNRSIISRKSNFLPLGGDGTIRLESSSGGSTGGCICGGKNGTRCRIFSVLVSFEMRDAPDLPPSTAAPASCVAEASLG